MVPWKNMVPLMIRSFTHPTRLSLQLRYATSRGTGAAGLAHYHLEHWNEVPFLWKFHSISRTTCEKNLFRLDLSIPKDSPNVLDFMKCRGKKQVCCDMGFIGWNDSFPYYMCLWPQACHSAWNHSPQRCCQAMLFFTQARDASPEFLSEYDFAQGLTKVDEGPFGVLRVVEGFLNRDVFCMGMFF